MDTAMLDVVVMVAVSEDGRVSVSADDDHHLIQKRKHENWLRMIREDEKLWTLKTIKTQVPMPVQYEDQTAD